MKKIFSIDTVEIMSGISQDDQIVSGGNSAFFNFF
jgi:hypothetical protein